MKQSIKIWMLTLILTVFISVPVLAVDDVTTYKDDEGNTITVEVGEHDSNTGSDVIVLPEPAGGSGSGSGSQSGGSSGTHSTPAQSGKTGGGSGGSSSDSDVIVLPSADEQDAQDAAEDGQSPDAETDEAGGDAQQADEGSDTDDAKAKSKSDGKLPAGTAYTLIGILSVILIAGIVYLVRSRKKE